MPRRSVIALVGCSRSKSGAEFAEAHDLYTSPLFRMSLAYAHQLKAHVYILSAQHGIVSPWDEIETYDLSLYDLDAEARRDWGIGVASKLDRWHWGARPRIVVLAGRLYADAVRPCIQMEGVEWQEPMRGMMIGERLRWLNEHLAEVAA